MFSLISNLAKRNRITVVNETIRTKALLKRDQWKRTKPDKRNRDRKIGPRLESDAKSLAAKGFLRPQKEYNPPANVTQTIHEIASKILGESFRKNDRLIDQQTRFNLFIECHRTFDHSIPNSLLYTINNVQDIIDFYNTPICTQTPFDSLLTEKLPENLTVQPHYIRFSEKTSKIFDNVTAYPKSSTIVTGLKYRKKYPGHVEEPPFTDC